MIATPNAPPVWRVVSLTAEPTPAFAFGSEPMIDSVAGAMTNPMPTPNSSRTAPPPTKDLITGSTEYSIRPVATIDRPVTTTSLVPTRSTSLGACGAVAMIPIATGAVSNPALNGEYPRTNWKYCVSRNVDP